MQDRLDGPGFGGDPHCAPGVLAQNLAEEVEQGQVWRGHGHNMRHALRQLAHDGLQALTLLLRHRPVGLRHGQRLPEGDADVTVGQALAEQLAAAAAIVIAACQHKDPIPAEVPHQLHHDLHLVMHTWRRAQRSWEMQLAIDGTVGDLPEARVQQVLARASQGPPPGGFHPPPSALWHLRSTERQPRPGLMFTISRWSSAWQPLVGTHHMPGPGQDASHRRQPHLSL